MPLPNFIIAGERRCGTTSLANLLTQHPEIGVHDKRDSGYFIDEHIRKDTPYCKWEDVHSASDYSGFFSELSNRGKTVIAEKSADYLYYRPAHPRMAAILPKCQYVVILRNPTYRAWSHFWNEVGKGREHLSFEKALAQEPKRLSKGGFDAYHLSYVNRGFYDESLADFIEVVGRNRVHVVILEEIIQDLRNNLDALTDFLQVGRFAGLPERKKSNSNWTMVPKPWTLRQPAKTITSIYGGCANVFAKVARRDREERRQLLRKLEAPFKMDASQFKMPDEQRDELDAHFASHIVKLENILGRPINVWRRPAMKIGDRN